jgi:8-oxo-dGTP diphosphatase
MATGDPSAGVPVVVGAAILHPDGTRVLAAQRSRPAELAGQWEFPGGKVEPGEDERTALRRECREELGVEVEPLARLGGDLPAAGGRMVLRVWVAALTLGEPEPREHAALRWLRRDELHSVRWLAPDLPLVDRLPGWLQPG